MVSIIWIREREGRHNAEVGVGGGSQEFDSSSLERRLALLLLAESEQP
jgi:hypothetical protein